MADPKAKRSAPRVETAARTPKAGRYVPVDKVGRGDNPLTSEVIYDDEQREFIAAVQAWRKKTGRTFPSNTELLAIAKSLGYRKPEPPKG